MAVDRQPVESARAPGRPRDPETDRAILQAAVDVLEESGFQGVTLSAVARRAGVARATIYLRWPTREALLGAMIRSAGGGLPFPLTGDLATDIRTGSAFARKVTSADHFIALLPELVAAVLANPQQMAFSAIAPNSIHLTAEYRAEAAAQGFDPDVDPHLAFDMVLGAQLIHMFRTRSSPPAGYARDLAEVVIAGLRVRDAWASET